LVFETGPKTMVTRVGYIHDRGISSGLDGRLQSRFNQNERINSMSQEKTANQGFHTRAARRYLRRRLDMRVRIAVKADSNEFVLGRCITVSEGGFGAILTGELPEGSDVWVEFRTPKVPADTRLRAQIRQRRGFQYGFQFVAPSPKHKILIRQIFAEGSEFV
jgi:hypothetical protein